MRYCSWEDDDGRSEISVLSMKFDGVINYVIHVKGGNSYVEETYESLIVRLHLLKDMGYYVPERAFSDNIRTGS